MLHYDILHRKHTLYTTYVTLHRKYTLYTILCNFTKDIYALCCIMSFYTANIHSTQQYETFTGNTQHNSMKLSPETYTLHNSMKLSPETLNTIV